MLHCRHACRGDRTIDQFQEVVDYTDVTVGVVAHSSEGAWPSRTCSRQGVAVFPSLGSVCSVAPDRVFAIWVAAVVALQASVRIGGCSPGVRVRRLRRPRLTCLATACHRLASPISRTLSASQGFIAGSELGPDARFLQHNSTWRLVSDLLGTCIHSRQRPQCNKLSMHREMAIAEATAAHLEPGGFASMLPQPPSFREC